MGYKAANNTWATIPGTVAALDTSLALTAGHGARFNFCSGTYNYTLATLIDTSASPPTTEIVKLTYSGSGDSVTVARAQEGSAALAIATPGAGRLECRLTKGVIDLLETADDLQTTTDIRAVTVGGTANAITSTHARPLSDIVGTGNDPADGMLSIFVPTGRNTTAAVTYSPDGLTAKAVVLPGNKTLPEGALRPSMKAIVLYDSTIGAWILQNAASVPFEALAGTISGATTLDRSHHGKVIQCAGTFTLSLAAAATLGADWWAIVQVQSGIVTLDPNASETIVTPDQTSRTTLPMSRSAVLLTCTGSGFRAFPLDGNTNITIYNTPGTFTHRFNPMSKSILAFTIGGGGGGGGGYYNGSAWSGAGGGGGGGYSAKFSAAFSREETVTVGAGGAGGAVSLNGSAGGASSLGSIASATGGGGGTGYAGGSNPPGGSAGSPGGTTGGAGVYGAVDVANGGSGGTYTGVAWLSASAGVGGSSSSGSPPATAGTLGCGGGGGHGNNQVGAAGGSGVVIVIESI